MSAGAPNGGRPRLIGASVTRKVDDRLLRGGGRYVADLEFRDMVHAHVLRSEMPHALVKGADTAEALATPGVHAVLTRADLTGAMLPCIQVQPGQKMEEYEVIPEVARYVGQTLGLVVADSRPLAEDAAELVSFDYEERPPVVSIDDALADDTLLYPEYRTNLLLDFSLGDPEEEVDAIIAGAPHVARLEVEMHRHAGVPMETRGSIADWDQRREHLTLYTSTQVAHHVRDHVALALGLRVEQVRVIAPDVGGGFGVKDHVYPDEIAVCKASMMLCRPVKWIEDRVEHMVATVHARDHRAEATLAVDEEGNFVAFKLDIIGNLGGHASNVGAGPAAVGASCSEGPYAFGRARARVRAVVTNRTPVGAYRGFGMPEGCFARERLIDEICRTGGFDHNEIRLRNMVRADQMPFQNRIGLRLDSGDYAQAFERCVEMMGPELEDPRDGKKRVRVVMPYNEMTAVGPTKWMQMVGFRAGGYETSVVEMGPDGSVTIRTGVCTQGQGHETVFAQIVAEGLGLGIDDVRVIQGDTDEAPYSMMGTIASRSLTLAGGAAVTATARIRDTLVKVAAHQLEASEDDIEIAEGRLSVRGVPSAFRTVGKLAESVWLGWDIPDTVQPGQLLEREVLDPKFQTVSYAAHGYDLAIDPELGKVEVERMAVSHDCGTVVNPMLVEGQTHGGLAQALGEVLLESFEYDDYGQPLTITFKDYLIPVSETMPDVLYEHFESPAPHIPGGFKGTGEGGTVTGPAAIASGLARLYPELSPHLRSTNMNPHRVWELLDEHVGSQ